MGRGRKTGKQEKWRLTPSELTFGLTTLSIVPFEETIRRGFSFSSNAVSRELESEPLVRIPDYTSTRTDCLHARRLFPLQNWNEIQTNF
jgi:hypothetical protein